MRLVKRKAPQLDTTYQLQTDEPVWLDSRRLVELRRVAIHDVDDVIRLKTVACLVIRKSPGGLAGQADRAENEQESRERWAHEMTSL